MIAVNAVTMAADGGRLESMRLQCDLYGNAGDRAESLSSNRQLRAVLRESRGGGAV